MYIYLHVHTHTHTHTHTHIYIEFQSRYNKFSTSYLWESYEPLYPPAMS